MKIVSRARAGNNFQIETNFKILKFVNGVATGPVTQTA